MAKKIAKKRNKVEKYVGIYYREVPRLDGQGTERMYYVTYRRGGRESPVIEEPIGRASEGWTPAKVNLVRGKRIAGTAKSNAEQREEAKLEKQKREAEGPFTVGKAWKAYSAFLEGRPTAKLDEVNIKHLSSLLDSEVQRLTTQDINALSKKLAKTKSKLPHGGILSPQTIKHILGLLKRMLRFADAQGLCPFPSALKINMPKVDNQKTETMTQEQMAAYWQALNAEADQTTASILRVALLTGIRRTALFSLSWQDVDFERGQICLRGESAKSGKTQYIPMSQAVADVLNGVERTEDNDLVWPSPRTGKRRDNINRMARRVRDKAGLPKDFRPMHGLRHTFASFLASSGQVDLYTLQKLLTHQSPQMTQRYAHLADEALKRATSVTDNMISHPTIDKS